MKKPYSTTRIAVVMAAFTVAFILTQIPKGMAQVRPGSLTNTWQIKPQAIPTTLTDISALGTGIPANRDLYVCRMEVNIGVNQGTVNVTIQDKQASPIPFWPVVPVVSTATTGQNNNAIAITGDDGCRWFPGGISVLASATGTYIYASGKY